jgi:dihydrofolate reductase
MGRFSSDVLGQQADTFAAAAVSEPDQGEPTMGTEVGWKNSQLLGPDVPAAVKKLRAKPGGEIRVWGSTKLIRTLAEHDLVDEYRLAVYPLVLTGTATAVP